jgi:hypothetical protein
MAKLYLPMGATLSGRLGKSNYIASRRDFGTVLSIREKKFVPTKHTKRMGERMHYLQGVYKAYRSAILVGLPYHAAEKIGDKSLNCLSRFMRESKGAIRSQSLGGVTTYSVALDKLVLASGREALPANLQAVSAAGSVKVTWTPYAGDDPATKRQKIGIVVVSEDAPLKPILELGSKKRTDSECTVALGGLTGNLHAYVFVYDNTEGKRLASAQALFAL